VTFIRLGALTSLPRHSPISRTYSAPRDRASWLAAACLALGLGVGAALSVAWHFVLADLVQPPFTYDLVIPAGTAELVSQGAAPPSIPTSLSFGPDDKLRIVNQDSVAHRIGQFVVQPGQEGEFPLSFSGQGGSTERFVCTIHPGSVLDLTVKPDASFLTSILLPTLALGLPLGLVSFGVVSVTSRLES
jgi:hypothetical protein